MTPAQVLRAIRPRDVIEYISSGARKVAVVMFVSPAGNGLTALVKGEFRNERTRQIWIEARRVTKVKTKARPGGPIGIGGGECLAALAFSHKKPHGGSNE